jgi:sialate O-acetylesterase
MLIKRLLCSLLFLLLLKTLSGAVILPPVFSNHLVLQQFSWVNLWGRADPGEAISIVTSWDKKSYSVQADKEGHWKLKFFSGGPGGPYSICFTGKNKVELKDVMVGEVWICSGQSNMEFTFNNLGGWKDFPELKRSFDTANLYKMRLCTIGKQVALKPADSCQAEWKIADSSSVLNFSATAFYFGLEIYRKFKVPVGLIVSSFNGTPAEAWTPDEWLRYTPGLPYYLNHPNNPTWEASAPSVLFNGMIYPLRNYSIRGFIWYQGESNRYDCDLYATLFTTMIKSWRKYWGQYELPFFFVQIAPFDYHDYDEASGYLREAQEKALTLENTGMAVTLDIGNLGDIHPKKKQEVGRRLASMALAKTYTLSSDKSCKSPAYWFSRKESDGIQAYFKNSEILNGNNDHLTGFRIAGRDGIFKPAHAVIMGNSVMLNSKEVPDPIYIRYAFRNTDTASVFDSWGLPAGSFRTDSLQINYRVVNVSAAFNPVLKNWKVGLNCSDHNATIHYTTDGSLPGLSSAIYTDTLKIDAACHLNAMAMLHDVPAQSTASVNLVKHEALGCKTVFIDQPSDKYRGNEYTLTDGINGSANFRDGRWMGFQSADLQAVIDLGQEKLLNSVKLNFLVHTASFIFPPVLVEIYTSLNGSKFYKAGSFKPLSPDSSSVHVTASIISVTADKINRQARYVKVIARNQNTNPPWHFAAGQKCWLFVDEVECR